jgi:hypothetical protein
VNAVAQGHYQPTIQRLVPAVPVLGPVPSFSKLSFSFCDDAVTNDFIYAGDSQPPTGDIDSFARISFHRGMYDSFTADLNVKVPIVRNPSNGSPILNGSLVDVYTIHGILMFLAWCVSPFIGIFIAKHCKFILGHKWYHAHLFVMGFGTGLLSLASFILVILYRPGTHFVGSSPLRQSHVTMGLVTMILMLVQIGLGFVINHLFDAERTEIPIRDKIHWFLGRFLTLFAIANSYLGLAIFDEMYTVSIGVKVGFWVIIGLGVLSIVYGEIRLGSSHHIKETPSHEALIASNE